MTQNSPVNIAVVGCGAITRLQHLPALLRSPEVNLYALVDVRRENAEEFTDKFSLKCNISNDLNDVINKVDGVLIATPNHTHLAVAEIALKHSVPVLIEKPITTTYADAIRLCELAERKNTFISVGYYTRHYPSVILLKQLLQQDFFGKISHFHYEYGTSGGWSPVSGYNIDRTMSGGGVLIVVGAHFLDRMLYWFGEPKGCSYRDDSHGGVEANCKAELVFESNLGKFTGSFFISKSIRLDGRFSMETENYICELGESDSEKITLFPKDNLDMKMEISPRAIDQSQKSEGYFQLQVEEFAENIRQQDKITVDGRFAVIVA